MSTIAEILLLMAYLWIGINIMLILYAILKRIFSKNTLTKSRKKALKTTIKINFICTIFAFIVGFLLL